MIIIWRLCLPETNHFQVIKAEREAREAQEAASKGREHKATGIRAFAKNANKAMRQNWFLFAYMVVLMTGYNSISHGSQDLYPTYLKNQVKMGPTQVTVITVVGQIGALIGSTLVGYLSTFTGRRPAMIVAAIIGGALVPSYIFIRNDNLIATVFFEQFFVGGSWGSIPVKQTHSDQDVRQANAAEGTPYRAQPASTPLVHCRRDVSAWKPGVGGILNDRGYYRRALPASSRPQR